MSAELGSEISLFLFLWVRFERHHAHPPWFLQLWSTDLAPRSGLRFSFPEDMDLFKLIFH